MRPRVAGGGCAASVDSFARVRQTLLPLRRFFEIRMKLLAMFFGDAMRPRVAGGGCAASVASLTLGVIIT